MTISKWLATDLPPFASGLARLARVIALLLWGALALPVMPMTAEAQERPGTELEADPSAPPVGRRVVLRFITESDFPPFNYLDAEGSLTGFNVDLARAICLEVNAACDIKVRPWGEQYQALQKGEADASIAAQRVTWSGVSKVEFSQRYLSLPGHFAGKRDGVSSDTSPEALEGKPIAVAKGTAHEAFLRAFYTESTIKTYETVDLAREALLEGKVAMVFDDAISLALWANGTNSRQCCELKGAAYSEPKFFGDGLAIAVPKGDRQLRLLINSALVRVRASGRLEELMQRYFPVRTF